MQEQADMELLRQYAQQNSEEAFTTLVARHVNMVYSVALRKTNNPHAAEEITQAVFIILAKKATTLREGTVLSGWLYQAASLTGASFLKSEIRRVIREQEAYMQSLHNEPEADAWLHIAPLLEDAMGRLGEKDRNAVVLRFFEGKSFQEVGAACGASENAAKKRVAYALEKLRKYFLKRGVISTTAVIAGAMATNSVQAAPVVLVDSIAPMAMAKGVAVSSSTLILSKGAMKLMAWTKVKMALVIGLGVLVATGATTVIVETIKKPVGSESLTLKVNPDVFIRNVMARADETMNTASNHHGDILLDALRMEGFMAGSNTIVFNTALGEITTRNTPDNLEIFRKIVADLNRADGARTYPPMDASAPKRRSVLIEAQLFKMSGGDFDKLELGKPTFPGIRDNARFKTLGESSFWMLSPESLQKVRGRMGSTGLSPFRSANIQTAYGIAASLYNGEPENNMNVKCLPLSSIDEKTMELKVQVATTGWFNRNPEGDWPVFAGRTNCAVFARPAVEIGGGLLFLAKNREGSPIDRLVVMIGTKPVQ